MQYEYRYNKGGCEIRARADGSPMIAGYAAVFNSLSQNLGGFVEEVGSRAFEKTIKEADVRALGNHDVNWLLGRMSAGTLRLSTDTSGLEYEIDVNKDDPDGQRALAKVDRGDMDGSSFGFVVLDDEWGLTEQGFPKRTLNEVALRDVGPVTFPAYLDTTVTKRALNTLAANLNVDFAEVAAAAEAGELRALMERDPEDSDEPTGEPEPHSTPHLDIARRRLLLAERRLPPTVGRGSTAPTS